MKKKQMQMKDSAVPRQVRSSAARRVLRNGPEEHNATSRLKNAQVHEFGQGKAMLAVTLNLVAQGVGRISANDPQALDDENRPAYFFAREPDRGRAKVYVLERFLDGHRICFEPLAAPNEAEEVDGYAKRAHVLLCGANTVSGRRAAAAKAVRFRKPLIDVSILDARQVLGGCIKLWLPSNPWSACPACYLPHATEIERGEVLPWSVVAMTGATAANMAVQLLTGSVDGVLRERNLFMIDAAQYQIESLAVERRQDCGVCSGR